MQPNNKPRPSLDGVRRSPASTTSQRKPDYRPDHELPAPEPTPLLNEPEKKTTLIAASNLTDKIPDLNLFSKKPNGRKKWFIFGAIGAIVVLLIAFIAAFFWYQGELAPVSDDPSQKIRVSIKSGTAPGAIATQLKSSGVIRSEFAFGIYTKLSNTENTLKAGIYDLQPSLSTPAIVDQLVAGTQDTFSVTFLPGDTLANSRERLIDLGIFSTEEVDAALNKKYDRPLFATKPSGADLEGYIYGETIEFNSSATVEAILNRFFDEYEAVIKQNDIVAKFEKQGLSLYEGIILASIVQRETSVAENQRQIARVFMNRMDQGMNLGSDVTYQYAAKKMGVAPDPRLDSVYNTRIHAGLPPGPIASPGKTALIAVANPGTNNYLFFLSGDDNLMYYGKTDAEHQQNIVKHCHEKCLIP